MPDTTPSESSSLDPSSPDVSSQPSANGTSASAPPSSTGDAASAPEEEAPAAASSFTAGAQRKSATQDEAADPLAAPTKIEINDLNFWYGTTHALKNISMQVRANQVTALIGASGSGKSTLIRCLNRMNELIPGTRLEGDVLVEKQDIYDADPVMVRRRIGMVFQKPNPFPKSIYKNVIWGALINGYQGDQDELVEKCLRQAALWDEVKDRLHTSAYDLSGGQQQRLCIARSLAVEPDVLLMDEPASALDPVATSKVEETIVELSTEYTVVIVTHNMQQASRISDMTAFMHLGKLVEMNPTDQLFTRPEKKRTEDYITGRFG